MGCQNRNWNVNRSGGLNRRQTDRDGNAKRGIRVPTSQANSRRRKKPGERTAQDPRLATRAGTRERKYKTWERDGKAREVKRRSAKKEGSKRVERKQEKK